MELTKEQLDRYSRHIILKEIGRSGQEKLADAKVLMIGAGGLGSPVAMYLAAAGIGTIGIADGDAVDLSNLQRQIIHATTDIGKLKAESARETIEALNPNVTVKTYDEFLTSANIIDVISEYDYVIECTDSFESKFLINDACVMAGKPFTISGVLRFEGQIISVKPHETPCYRCVFPYPPPKGLVPTCKEAGLISPLPGTMGTLEALEAIKYITGIGDMLYGRMLVFDALSMEFNTVTIPERDPECPVCSENPEINELKDIEPETCEFK